MRAKKKPVEISCWLIEDLVFAFNNGTLPEEVQRGYEEGVLEFRDGGIYIQTLEGKMFGKPTSFLMEGVQKELYACDPDIFYKTYDVVDVPAEPTGFVKKHDGPCWRQSHADCGC